MRKLKYLIIITMILSAFCSCSKNKEVIKMDLSPNNKSLIELSTTTYNIQELKNIISFSGTIQELSNKYPIECIRKTQVGYRVSYYGESNFASIIFDNSGKKLIEKIYKESSDKTYFDSLSTGNSIEDVKKIDPNGDYSFLYTGRNDVPKQSIHYTSDGYLITINYNENNLISNIEKELI